jgi:nucleoside-diphosphate-sugar epimerase
MTKPKTRKGSIDFLVTGSSGFIGSALVQRLIRDGYNVQGCDLHAGREPTLRMDVSNENEVQEVFARVKPRKVIHLAAIVDDRGAPELFHRVNVLGTQHVATACQVHQVSRLIHVSSIVVLGFDPGHRADHNSPLVTNTGVPYFDTKAKSEQIVRNAMADGLAATIVRPGDVYGLNSDPWVIRPLDMMRKRLPILIHGGRGIMAHCAVENLVEGLFLAATRDEALGHVFQIHDGHDNTSYGTYFTALARAAGVPTPTLSIPRKLGLAMGRTFDLLHRHLGIHPPFTEAATRYLSRQASYSITLAQEKLGYVPVVTLEESLRTMFI